MLDPPGAILQTINLHNRRVILDMKVFSPEQSIQAARLFLVTELPFFGSVFLRLHVQEDDTCKTAWTDGVSIGYNPKYFKPLDVLKITGVFVHEVLHVILKHFLREELHPAMKDQHMRFNRAADYALNPRVLETKGCDLPSGVCLDLKRWNDEFAEVIFHQLKNEPEDQLPTYGGKGNMPGSGSPVDVGEVRPLPRADGKPGPASKEEKAQKANEIDQWIRAASFKASGMGKETADQQRLIKKIVAPVVTWEDELQMLVEEITRDDYTWKRPNSRYTQHGIYLPSMGGETMPDLVFYVDTSGSLTDEHLAQIMAEVRQIISLFSVRVIVVYWNTCYQFHEEFYPEDILEPGWHLAGKGGGGTSFTNCWEWLDDQDEIDPAGIVFFTDCETTDWPLDEPDVPVIWAQVPDYQGQYDHGYIRHMPDYGTHVTIPMSV